MTRPAIIVFGRPPGYRCPMAVVSLAELDRLIAASIEAESPRTHRTADARFGVLTASAADDSAKAPVQCRAGAFGWGTVRRRSG